MTVGLQGKYVIAPVFQTIPFLPYFYGVGFQFVERTPFNEFFVVFEPCMRVKCVVSVNVDEATCGSIAIRKVEFIGILLQAFTRGQYGLYVVVVEDAPAELLRQFWDAFCFPSAQPTEAAPRVIDREARIATLPAWRMIDAPSRAVLLGHVVATGVGVRGSCRG